MRINNLFGFDIMIKRNLYSYIYENIFPYSTYAPWLQDKSFIEAYLKFSKYSLVDKYRLYELWDLIHETNKLEGDVLEVGTWRGGSGLLMAQALLESKSQSIIYLCDTFNGVVKATDKDSYYKNGEHSNVNVKNVKKLIVENNLDNITILKGIFPDETSRCIRNKKIRLCHIDVDVLKSAEDIIEWVWKRLVKGGVIVLDDYGFKNCDGITKLVNSYKLEIDRLVFYNLNGHALIIKI